jgi:hypothetical protein
VTGAAWHALLAPLPDGAEPRRQPVASPELMAAGAAEAIAGWEDLVIELSAGSEGLRVVQVVRDGRGRLLGASDHVLIRNTSTMPPMVRQESIGGRFEPDGRFNGTCWSMEGNEPPEDAPPDWRMVRRAPTDGEVHALRRLVAETIERARR